MKSIKLTLIIIQIFITTSAWAEWVKVTSGGGGAISYYIDPSKITKHGNIRQTMELIDRTTPDSDGMLSLTGVLDYDCKENKLRWRSETWYDGNMGTGKVLRTDTSIRIWRQEPKGNTGNTLLRYVCSH